MGATEKQRAAILEHATSRYNKLKAEWQQVEATKKEIELEAAVVGHRGGSVHLGSRENSPTLSTISDSPVLSPARNKDAAFDQLCNGSHDPRDESHDVSHDGNESLSRPGEVLVNGNMALESHDQPHAELTNHSVSTASPDHHHQEDRSRDQGTSSHDQGTPSLDQNASSHDQGAVSHDHSCLNQEYPSAHSLSQDSLAVTPDPEELLMTSPKLDSHGRVFVKELYNIDKDIPRCDRDYWSVLNPNLGQNQWEPLGGLGARGS